MNVLNKIIRNKLYHHVAEVPDDIWSKIESRLPEEKKDIKPFWIIITSFAIIVSGIMTFMYFNDNALQNKENTELQNIDEIIAHFDSKPSPQGILHDDFHFDSKINKNRSSVSGIEQDGKDNIPKEIYTSAQENVIETKNSDVLLYPQQREIVHIGNALNNKDIKHFYKIVFPGLIHASYREACPTIEVKKMERSVEGYFSHDINIRHLNTTAGGMSEYAHMRETAEDNLYSFSAGIRYNHQLNGRWSFVTGFNFSQINERFQYVDPESNQTREITIKDYVYQNGKIVDSIITVKTEVIPGDKKTDIKNRLRSFDIPLLAKYKIFENRNIKVSAVTGLHLNLVSANTGMILDTDNSRLLDISQDADINNPVFKTWLGVSAYGSVNVSYKLTAAVDIFAEPHLRMQTASMTTDQYPLTQRYTTFGALTGVRYTF
jgi:hypothetical protein